MATGAILSIPARNDIPWYQMKISLSNVLYILEFRYNTRMQRWVFNILDSTGTTILLGGIVLLIDRDLMSRFVSNLLPSGNIFCTDVAGSEQPTRFSFGTTSVCLYQDPTVSA